MPKLRCPCGFVHDLSPIPDDGWVTVRDRDYEGLLAAEAERERLGAPARTQRHSVWPTVPSSNSAAFFTSARTAAGSLGGSPARRNYRVYHPEKGGPAAQ